jgi:adenine-specific DNA-methyltransferase
MVKYLGSKRLLIPLIVDTISSLEPCGTVVDLFSGTSRVGHAFKKQGYRVLSNDHNAYAHALGTCYVQADRGDHARAAAQLVQEFNQMPSGEPGYFTDTFCVQSRFFQEKNGVRIDSIREAIARKGLDPELEAILIVSLMEAADRVDATVGLHMAFLKQWPPRASHDLQLRVPELLSRAPSGKGQAHRLDALEAARQLDGDVCYLDPPYNQHKYIGNYHIWETLTLWDKPEHYGVACKRVDCRTRKSAFNAKREAAGALQAVVQACRARHLVVSFNDEGFLSRAEIESILGACRPHVVVFSSDFKRHVGAQVGIHNPQGEKVGRAGKLRNTEHLFIATPDLAAVDRLRQRAEAAGA